MSSGEYPSARLPGDDARDVIAMVEAVGRQDYSAMLAILNAADQPGLTIGLAVLSEHLLAELHGDQAAHWLDAHRQAALAMDQA
jgi:hypothetical protein